MRHREIQKGDFEIGDRVKINWIESIYHGKEATVIELEQRASYMLVIVKVGNVRCSFGLRSSLKKMPASAEQVVFT